jgi:hypothetical protein
MAGVLTVDGFAHEYEDVNGVMDFPKLGGMTQPRPLDVDPKCLEVAKV